METGNPKQVAILSVTAVLAIGFLVTRMHGQDLPKVAQAIVDKATGHSAATPLTYPMVTDPFSHAKLASTTTVANAESPTPTGQKQISPPFLDGLPPADGGPSGPIMKPPATETMPVKEVQPVAPKPEGTEILLEATAGASDAVAFLSVGGAESQPYRINDLIKGASKGKVRLLRVEDGAVVLSGPKGELTIGVGERKRI